MRNRRIVDAWDKIKPDSAADARMLDAILAHDKSKTRKGYPMKNFNWKRLAPIAACLVLAIAAVAAIPQFIPGRNAPVKGEQMTLPAMLAGQEVTWEAFPDENPAEPGETPIWTVMVATNDGTKLEMTNLEMKILGILADGRKITVAREEVSRTQVKKSTESRITLSVPDVEPALEIGSTIMTISHTDNGLTIEYRCYIEAIE